MIVPKKAAIDAWKQTPVESMDTELLRSLMEHDILLAENVWAAAVLGQAAALEICYGDVVEQACVNLSHAQCLSFCRDCLQRCSEAWQVQCPGDPTMTDAIATFEDTMSALDRLDDERLEELETLADDVIGQSHLLDDPEFTDDKDPARVRAMYAGDSVAAALMSFMEVAGDKKMFRYSIAHAAKHAALASQDPHAERKRQMALLSRHLLGSNQEC